MNLQGKQLLKTKGKPKKYQILAAVIIIISLIFLLKKMPSKIKKKIPSEIPKIEELKPVEEKKKEYQRKKKLIMYLEKEL